MESRDVPDNRSISRDLDMFRRLRVIGGCEFGVVRRKLWDTKDLGRGHYEKDRNLVTHNRIHAKGLIEYSHPVVQF